MARVEYPNGNKEANPLVVVEHDEVIAWLREKADELGLSDRASVSVQATITGNVDDAEQHFHRAPKLVLMLSNVPGSRTVQPRDVDYYLRKYTTDWTWGEPPRIVDAGKVMGSAAAQRYFELHGGPHKVTEWDTVKAKQFATWFEGATREFLEQNVEYITDHSKYMKLIKHRGEWSIQYLASPDSEECISAFKEKIKAE